MDEFLLGIANAKTPITLTVKVIPKSARNEIAGMLADGTLKVKIAAPPEKGQANEMLRAFLAEQCKLPKRRIVIVAGRASSRKIVRLG